MLKVRVFTIGFIFFSFFNCDQVSESSNKNEFQLFMDNLHAKQADILSFINSDINIYGFHKLIVDPDGQVIVVDNSNWSIHLFNESGESITSVGGSGEGPGEFQVINDISLSPENNLYLLDKRLHRVTSFSISQNKMEYRGTHSLPNYSPLTLESFYNTESQGYIGVFREFRREAGKRTPFFVYRLNKEFEIEEKLSEMPGNEAILLRNIAATDSPFGFRTFWQILNDHLFFTHSDDLSFTSIDLQTLETKTIHLKDEVPKHTMSRDLSDFLIEHFQMMIRAYPETEENIREKELLPYFRNFFVADRYVFFDIFPDNHDQAYILGFDRHSTDLFTIRRVPLWFTVSGILDNKIIGIAGAGSIDESDILTIDF